MNKAISIDTMFGEVPFYNRFALAKAAGFEYVEIGGWTELDLTRIAKELEANDMRLVGMVGTDHHMLLNPEEREGFLEHLSQSIAIAKSFSCKNLIISSAEDAKLMPLDKSCRSDFTKTAAAIRSLMDAAAMASRAGVSLHVKPLSVSPDPEVFWEVVHSLGGVIDAVDSPALGLLFPFGAVRTPKHLLLEVLRAYRGHIGYVHIGGRQKYLPSGGDMVDLSFVHRLLSDVLDFHGIASFVAPTGPERSLEIEKWQFF